MNNFKRFINKFASKKIIVMGDIMLDRYIQGNVSRISPEAPVPILLEEKSFYTPGGAANVAKNLGVLGAQVFQIGRVGNDFEGKLLKRELKRQKIDFSGVFTDKHTPTISKTRVIAQHQQVVRIDREKTNKEIDKSLRRKIENHLKDLIKHCDAIIISDYGKGLITPSLISFICSLALEAKKVIAVDPKVEHFNCYQKVTAITPNKKEAENAIRYIKIREPNGHKLRIHSDHLHSLKDIDKAGDQLLQFLNLDSLLITLGEQGMRLYEKGKKPFMIKTQAREVFDVSGAGDTVIAVFTLALTAGASKKQAAQLANYAAGVVVGKMGATAVTREELLKTVK